MIFWTAFTLGLVGSTHCLGMCGPLALAIPMSTSQRMLMTFQALKYNLGRVMTYALLGAVFGLLGMGVELAGIQKSFSIVIGVFLIFAAFYSLNWESKLANSSPLVLFFNYIKRQIGKLLRNDSRQSHLMIGVFNGFLPCGMVYLAIAGAITTGSVLNGMLFMALFGLGTLPLMLGIMLLGNVVKPSFKKALRSIAPFIMISFALLLIARGLNVNLPHELHFWEALQNDVMCH
jgi:sulfite exporter TauE/SafE